MELVPFDYSIITGHYSPAVKLDRRQLEMCGNVSILNLQAFPYGLSLEPLSCHRAGGDSRTTAKSLEFGLHDATTLIHLPPPAAPHL